MTGPLLRSLSVIIILISVVYHCFIGAEPTTPGGRPSFSLRWVYSDRMYPVMKSLFKLALIIFYFYLCDRYLLSSGKKFNMNERLNSDKPRELLKMELGHFRVHLGLHFKARLSAKPLFSFILKLELITITIISHLDSL